MGKNSNQNLSWNDLKTFLKSKRPDQHVRVIATVLIFLTGLFSWLSMSGMMTLALIGITLTNAFLFNYDSELKKKNNKPHQFDKLLEGLSYIILALIIIFWLSNIFNSTIRTCTFILLGLLHLYSKIPTENEHVD